MFLNSAYRFSHSVDDDDAIFINNSCILYTTKYKFKNTFQYNDFQEWIIYVLNQKQLFMLKMSIFILQICYVAVLAEEWTGGLSPHDSTTSPFSRCPHEIQDLKHLSPSSWAPGGRTHSSWGPGTRRSPSCSGSLKTKGLNSIRGQTEYWKSRDCTRSPRRRSAGYE